METLVQIAKRLGIRPNSKMTADYYVSYVIPALQEEYSKIRGKDDSNLIEAVYNVHKELKQDRSWDKKKVAQQLCFLKRIAQNGVRIYAQEGDVKLGVDGKFIYHSAEEMGVMPIERFQIDLKMDSPNMEQMWPKLDDFIIKHRASYKVEDLDGKKIHDRTDILNIYMNEEITPEIAKDVYNIIGPFLETEHDEFLAGFPVKFNGKNIKGFRYGPEPEPKVDEKQKKLRIQSIKKIAGRDLPQSFVDFLPINSEPNEGLEEYVSLGMLSALIEKVDLIYYLVGKEGKSPFQIGNQFGEPGKTKYNKVIDIAQTEIMSHNSSNTAVVQPTLIPQYFKDGKGHSGIRYLDQQGNIVLTEIDAPNCKTRVYSNGLTMRMWNNPQSTTYTDGSKTGKEAVEIMVTEAGRGCTKDVSTTGELKRKIEEVRKAGLLVVNLPGSEQKPTSLKGCFVRHSVSNSMVTSRMGRKV